MEIEVSEQAKEFYDRLSDKDRRIIKNHLLKLDHPLKRLGDIKELRGHKGLFRLHIGRTYTVFLRVYDHPPLVRVLDIMTIEQAHKKYGKYLETL